MKLEYLEYLIMLQKAGSINKSAALLHTSPQNVSRVLRSLEDELGVELVHRSLSGIEFTEAGVGAVDLGIKVLELMEAYKLQYRHKSQTEGKLNIFATKIQSALFMNDIVGKFTKLYPRISVDYIENDLFICLEKIRQMEHSVGLVPVLDDDNFFSLEDFSVIPVNPERIAVLVARNSAFGKQIEVTWKELNNGKFVIHARNNIEDGFWSEVLAHSIENVEDIALASTGYLFFNKILEEGYIGLGCERTSSLSENMQRREVREKTRIIPVMDVNSTFQNCLVIPNGFGNDPAVECLVDFMKRYSV